MATKARQQYFADEISLQKQRREFSLEDNIKQKIDSVEAGAQVNTIETVKVNGTALTPDANKAVNVEVPDVIDNLYSTSADDALSAKQGKNLYDYIQNIASRGRFLSNWNSATGLPATNPSESPYAYRTGDYYIISNIATGGGTNYRPDGSSYIIGQASTTVETDVVDVSDFYFYDGTNWLLLKNSGRSGAVDSSLSTTSTNPVENRVITQALNGKQDTLIAGTNIQIAADGKTVSATDTKYTAGTGINIDANNVISNTQTSAEWGNITGTLSNQTDLQNALNNKANKTDVLEKNNTTSYTPSGDYNPATKKYVEDSISAIDVGDKIVYATQAEYNALLPGALTDNKHYFIYTESGGGGWQPGANTVAYYPLDTDFNDVSVNANNLTNSGGVITTLDGVSCAYYDGSSHSATSTPTFTGTRTLSCWWNPASTSGVMGIIVTGNIYSNNEKWGIQQSSGVLWGSEWRTTNQSVNSNITVTTGTWYHVVTTIENGTDAKIYVNGVLANSLTRSSSIQNSYGLAVGSNFSNVFSEPATGYVSKAIIEDKARTAQEISDYFNQTKSTYGIS